VSGELAACDDGWCLDGTALDLGPAKQLANEAAADYDGNGSKDTNAEEFQGLEGEDVTLLVTTSSDSNVVYVVDGEDYRLADGSFTG
jgi:hypothetical protein